MISPSQLVDLHRAMLDHREWLDKQLTACQSGKFKLFAIENGRQVDTTPDQILQLKRMIAEYDRLLDTLEERNARGF
jgi:hypothetical protein